MYLIDNIESIPSLTINLVVSLCTIFSKIALIEFYGIKRNNFTCFSVFQEFNKEDWI